MSTNMKPRLAKAAVVLFGIGGVVVLAAFSAGSLLAVAFTQFFGG